MLPPVFYVQQLEQILLRKLLSPPTPAARPLRRRAAPRRRTYVRIQFFRSLFSCQAMSLWSRVSALRAAVFSCTPRLSSPPHLRLYPYSVFCSLFSCRAASIDLARLRCAAAVFSCTPRPSSPPHLRLYPYSVFASPFHFRPRPFGSAFVIFCFLVFPFFLDPYFRRFYDLFLRRKHLESLVRVIRPFGVRPRATRAKKFPA